MAENYDPAGKRKRKETMRSDRYKTSDHKTGMNQEEREDFWNGAPIGEHAEKPAAGQKAGSFIKSLLADVIIAVILASAVLYFIRPTIVKQTSMENTLHNNDYMVMYRLAYKNHDPERGDIIIFQSDLINEDSGKDKLLIKRVIGLPGDEIMIKDGMVYINGEEYPENYTRDGYTPAFEIPPEGGTYLVPEDSYFCMGDNREGSVDSRRNEVGPVPRDAIKGKVVIRLFPFNKIQRF